jgi:hypothetical protein
MFANLIEVKFIVFSTHNMIIPSLFSFYFALLLSISNETNFACTLKFQKTRPLGITPFDGVAICDNETCKNAIEGNHERYPGDFRKI